MKVFQVDKRGRYWRDLWGSISKSRKQVVIAQQDTEQKNGQNLELKEKYNLTGNISRQITITEPKRT